MGTSISEDADDPESCPLPIGWKAALKHDGARPERTPSMSTDEDQQLRYDEKLQDMEGIQRALKIAAKADFDLELG